MTNNKRLEMLKKIIMEKIDMTNEDLSFWKNYEDKEAIAGYTFRYNALCEILLELESDSELKKDFELLGDK